MKKTVLCYGDSNTWGYIPMTGERYGEDVRWPGVMRALLGGGYEVIEAGLSGRTSTWDDPWDPCLNGRDTLVPVMRMAAPLDLVILMLGTNDLKYHTAWESTTSCNTLIGMIRQNAALFRGGKANILWVSPPLLASGPSALMAEPGSNCNRAESEKFWAYYQEFADFLKVPCFNAASVATVAEGEHADGAHLSAESHRALGKALAEQVRRLI